MMFAANSIQSDCYAEWQAANGAAWCQRLSATITPVTCEEQQQQSGGKYGDFRCQGCKGLHDQPEPQPECPVLTFVQRPEELARPDASNEGAGIGEDDRHDSQCQMDDEELDDFLAEMFPDDGTDDDEVEERAYIEDPPETIGRRAMVYMGRCRRCGGYMTNDLERHDGIKDDDVYRCFTCGWRTSPGYERNRAIHAQGEEMH